MVFGSADHNIYGLDAVTGKERWRITVAQPVLGAVTIEKGIAYIGGSDSTFRAIRIKNGKVVWTYTGIKGYIETKPLVEGDKVIFGAWDNTLYALNKSNGKELWKWTGGLTHMHFSPAAVWYSNTWKSIHHRPTTCHDRYQPKNRKNSLAYLPVNGSRNNRSIRKQKSDL